jgi:hypothetical protein
MGQGVFDSDWTVDHGGVAMCFFPFVIFVGLVPPHYRLLGGFFYPSEKWSEFVSWDDELPNIYGKS